MNISLECQYAIRSIFELARQYGQGTVPVSEIAKTYDIPDRFLELILNKLKAGGFVISKRGVQGGFLLAVPPKEVTIGQIIRYIDGPLDPVGKCVVGRHGRECPRKSSCTLRDLWDQARTAVEGIYDSANFEDLVNREVATAVADYCI